MYLFLCNVGYSVANSTDYARSFLLRVMVTSYTIRSSYLNVYDVNMTCHKTDPTLSVMSHIIKQQIASQVTDSKLFRILSLPLPELSQYLCSGKESGKIRSELVVV